MTSDQLTDASNVAGMGEYRPSRVGEVFYLQLGAKRQKVLMRVTERDGENFKATSAGVDDVLTAKPPIPTIVWDSGK